MAYETYEQYCPFNLHKCIGQSCAISVAMYDRNGTYFYCGLSNAVKGDTYPTAIARKVKDDKKSSSASKTKDVDG